MITVTEKNWLQCYDREIPASINYPEQALHELVEQVVERFPNHVALEFLGKSLIYKEFAHSVRRIANHS